MVVRIMLAYYIKIGKIIKIFKKKNNDYHYCI